MTKVKDLVKFKHPNSRKTNALAKQIKKAKSREKSKQTGNLKLNLIGEKIMWFKDNLNVELDSNVCTSKQVLELIEKYLSRFDDELQQIKIKHSIGNRKNRQHANREDIINMTIKSESEEFNTAGIEIPDLLNFLQFKLLKEWNGELRYLPKFKLKRYSRKHLEQTINDLSIQPKNGKMVEINAEASESSRNVQMDVS